MPHVDSPERRRKRNRTEQRAGSGGKSNSSSVSPARKAGNKHHHHQHGKDPIASSSTAGGGGGKHRQRKSRSPSPSSSEESFGSAASSSSSAASSATAASRERSSNTSSRSGGTTNSVNIKAGKKTAKTLASLSKEDAEIYSTITAVVNHWQSSSKLLTESFIRTVLRRVRPVLMSQPMLVRVAAPVNVCGDLHGQITDLVEILKAGGLPPTSRYLFLGDYVDRGKYGSEVITVLLGFKALFPDRVYLLRGNHEADNVCRIYGFFDEVKRRFSVKLFKEFTDVFNCLPISALIEDIALCMHGGLSPELRDVRQIEQIPRPLVVPDEGLACDILWSDPEAGSSGWQPSERGVSFTFGEDVAARVCKSLDIDIVLRAHQVVDEGYSFFAGRRVVTIFSASNYCGEFTNSGAMMIMDEACRCSFQIFKPVYGR